MTCKIQSKKGMGWKFHCLSLTLNLALICTLIWFIYKVDKKDKLIDEYLSGAETCAKGIFDTEVLNYHFVKKHQHDPYECIECAFIIDAYLSDVEKFYKENK